MKRLLNTPLLWTYFLHYAFFHTSREQSLTSYNQRRGLTVLSTTILTLAHRYAHLQFGTKNPTNYRRYCIVLVVMVDTKLRHLCSAARGNLQVLACCTSSFRPRRFAACALKLWNSIPPSLWDPTLSLSLFCSRLETHLFSLPMDTHL